MRRYPVVAYLATRLWRLGRPRYTAGVVGIVFNAAGDVLLVEHVLHPKYPWGLPGGWVDRGDGLEEAVIRELREELELTVWVEQVVLVEMIRRFGAHIDLAFLCSTDGEVGKLSSELLGYRWTPQQDLPELTPFHARAIQQAIQLRS